MANPYDVNMVFAEMEQELILSFKRNMHKYTDTSDMWQAMKMKDLEIYRREVAQDISKATKKAKDLSKLILKGEFLKGADKVDAFMKQFNLDVKPSSERQFFKANRRKLNALLESVYGDLDNASHAAYRQMDDVYRQTIFKAEIARSSGVYTNEQAIDVATKDFLEKGINCIRYANGAMVNIASYSEMVLRTSGKRALLIAEGARNQEWGVTTIKITQHGSTCPLCSPWQGKVLIDDVYSGGKASDGDYPLLSTAMAEGLFHPNCRHGSGTYFEGITEVPEPFNQAEVEAKYEVEQQQRYNERKIRGWKRKASGSMDEGNRRKAEYKVKEWQSRQRQLLEDNDWLRRNYSRESIRGIGLEKNLPKIEPKIETTSVRGHVDMTDKANYTKAPWQHIQKDIQVPEDRAKDIATSIKRYTTSDYAEANMVEYQWTGKNIGTAAQDVANINEYIDKAPKWNAGTLYRGSRIPKTELSQIEVGKPLTQNRITSWSSKSEIADKFAKFNLKSGEESVKYVIDLEPGTATSGVSIQHLSGKQGEAEVLFKKDVDMIVTKVETVAINKSRKMTVIHLSPK